MAKRTYIICFWDQHTARESVYTESLPRALWYRFIYKCPHKITHKTLVK